MMLFELVKELLFPRKCVLCGRILNRDETHFCRNCRAETPGYDGFFRRFPNLDAHTAIWFYEGAVRESLLRFKFHNRPGYAPAYASLMALRVMRDLPAADVITWVPVSGERLQERGYDQAELLAKATGKELQIPVVRLLDKCRNNQAQSGIDDAKVRRENVRGAYRSIPDAGIARKRILLIDDILTTGATAGECAHILREAGASGVILAVVAAGKRHK